MAEVLLARIQHGAGPLGMVGAVGILLALQTDANVLGILLTKLADDVLFTIDTLEITTIYLYTRLVGIHLHEDTRLGAIERSTNLCVITIGVQAPVVVVTMSIFNLIVF